MAQGKLKLVYDVTLLKNGLKKSGLRSGVFFVTLNVLKKLWERTDVDLSLTCKPSDFHCIEHVLDKEIPQARFDFKINESKFFEFYSKIKFLKKIASVKNHRLENILFGLVEAVFSPIFKLVSALRPKCNFGEYDAFLSSAYLIPNQVKTKKFVILHDLIPLLLPEYKARDWKPGNWLYDLCKTLNHDDYYFTNSEYTRKDFLKHYPQIDPNKITTTLLACDEHFRPSLMHIETVKEKYNIPKGMKYVFSLCSPDPRKNLQRTACTFVEFLKKNDIEDMVFVLGGGNLSSFLEKLYRDIEGFGEYKNKIIKAGYIDDEDLPALYSGAEWFTYTSMYEGFGLPPLEAMSCGCPVITSNNSSLPEVVGDAGILINWNSDQQHIEAYEKYYFNPKLRKANSEKGLERTRKFSWDKCVDTMVEVMKRETKK